MKRTKKEYTEESDSEENENTDSDESDEPMDTGNVMFEVEGDTPTDTDYHGIKMLLNQLFLKTINCEELSNYVISHNQVASVLRQVLPDDEDDSSIESDDVIFGLTTVIDLHSTSSKLYSKCINELNDFFLSRSSSSNPSCHEEISELFKTKCIGLLIHERCVNLPPQICVPAFECVQEEVSKVMKNRFSHFVIVCKKCKIDSKSPNGDSVSFVRPEDSIFVKHADFVIEFSVADDMNVTSLTDENGDPIVPYRTIVILTADKLKSAFTEIKETYLPVSM